MYNPKNIHHKIFTRIGVLIVIVGIIIYFTVVAAAKLRTTVMQISDEKEHSALIRSETDASLSLLTELYNVEGNMPRIYEALPAHDYIVPTVDRIEALALEHNLVLTADWSNPMATDTRLPSLIIGNAPHQLYTIIGNLRLEGNAQSFEYFLRALEALPYFMRVQNIEAVSVGDASWEHAAVFRLEINLATMQK